MDGCPHDPCNSPSFTCNMKNSFWSHTDVNPDTYSLFRGCFTLSAPSLVEFRVVGSAWYQAWLDGSPLLEGPLRFALDRPEYQIATRALSAGEHVLAFHAHHIGAETRILKDTPPFLWCEALANDKSVSIVWRGKALESQTSQTRRINPQLGWIEWRDTRLDPTEWEKTDFDDSSWSHPVTDASALSEPGPVDLAPLQTFYHTIKPIAEGPLATTFGYVADEPSFTFYSRDRICENLPPKGLWRRYDLGRVRLGRPRFHLDVPAGTIVEFGSGEYLIDGRTSPYINFSTGTSCNLDRFIARGGEQTFCPLTPKGGRFLEVHVVNAREGVRFLREEFIERGYHAPTEAAFACGDPLLEAVWKVGIETYRACAEDALIDNPTRERGQWVGDVASVGMEIAGVGYHDLRLCKRALIQCALCPREDGLVAGMSPGGCIYLPTYAFQWTVAATNYHRLTGDRDLLEELWEPALRNMAAIRAFWHPDGLHNVAGWNFVDWGYRTEDGPVDTACNLHYLWALRSMVDWAKILGQGQHSFPAQIEELTGLLQKRIAGKLARGGWKCLGYHCATLAMRLGLISNENGCLDFLIRHLESCFPNDSAAARNDDPTAFNDRVITPYFAHYVMPLLIERGRMDFVLGQFRHCWGGYMLENGRTTWLEVFDTHWGSHCHQWSGCPTWQMSRYLLGLHPRFDIGYGTFDFRLEPGLLQQASGRLPHPDGGWIEILWRREKNKIRYSLSSPHPIRLRFPDGKLQNIKQSSIFAINNTSPNNPSKGAANRATKDNQVSMSMKR